MLSSWLTLDRQVRVVTGSYMTGYKLGWACFSQAMWAYWRYSLNGFFHFYGMPHLGTVIEVSCLGDSLSSIDLYEVDVLLASCLGSSFWFFDTSWWHVSMLWRFVRSGWIDSSVLTWSRLWPILLARIGSWVVRCPFGFFHPMFHSFGNVWLASYCFHSFPGVMQSKCFCDGFPWILFGSGWPCLFLEAPATPSSSKPVHCTDLVDASESCWGGKKKTRTNALSVCGISKLPWHLCNGRTVPLIDCIRRFSVSDPTRPWRQFVCLDRRVIWRWGKAFEKLGSPSFPAFRWLKGSPATIVACQQRTAKKGVSSRQDTYLCIFTCLVRSCVIWRASLHSAGQKF